MGSSGFRNGNSGQVYNTMMDFNSAGTAEWKFSGKDLLNGQTDGSSFPNGGLRATHTAGAYLTVDPESPPFIMNDTVYIPAVFAAYSGVALDEKVPLHRSVQSLSKEGKRLLGHMGVKTDGLVNHSACPPRAQCAAVPQARSPVMRPQSAWSRRSSSSRARRTTSARTCSSPAAPSWAASRRAARR